LEANFAERRPFSLALNMRFSAARRSLRRTSSWFTLPVM
jgi:hypothetical protein